MLRKVDKQFFLFFCFVFHISKSRWIPISRHWLGNKRCRKEKNLLRTKESASCKLNNLFVKFYCEVILERKWNRKYDPPSFVLLLYLVPFPPFPLPLSLSHTSRCDHGKLVINTSTETVTVSLLGVKRNAQTAYKQTKNKCLGDTKLSVRAGWWRDWRKWDQVTRGGCEWGMQQLHQGATKRVTSCKLFTIPQQAVYRPP